MDPIVPPELVATHVSRKEAHADDNDGYYASHVGCHPNSIRKRIVWSVAKSGLDAKYSCNTVSDTPLANAAMNIPKVSSYVHNLSRHGSKIAVEFAELHWHSVSRRPHPMAGRFETIHSSCTMVS
jgi:hypothetical protein